MSAESFEFNSEQNRLIADLAAKMRGIGVFLIASGALCIVACGIGLATGRSGIVAVSLLAGIFFSATGLWTTRAGRSFKGVIDIEGNDIALVTNALRELDRFFTLNQWLVIAIVLVLLTAVIDCPSILG